MPSLRFRPLPVIGALVLLLATAAAAGAQTSPAPTPPPTTATTAAPPTTGPTTTAFLGIFPPTTAPATTAPSPTPTTAKPGSAPATTSPGPIAGDAVPPPGTSRAVPPDAQRQIDAVRRSGPNNTSAWLAALQPLVTELGMTPTDAAIMAGGHFPIAGPANWSDDWLNARYVPTFHLHKGVDMFAASGTPVRAPFDGVLKMTNGAVGGMASYVTLPDGTFYYMAHLSAFVPGKTNGQQVKQGEIVGFVGDSGDAKGGSPHVHFEFHPMGGAAAPPKPGVDAWLAEATAAAPQVIAAARAARNPAAPGASASVTAVPDGTTIVSAEAPVVDPAAALWAASSNPAIGTIDLASSLVASVADSIEWPAPPG
ncbi:MAG: M23 family metallopeptidase [Acidimicrobiales bacterium]